MNNQKTLKQKVLSGTKWIALANFFRQALQIVSLIVFARLLTPDDFGLYAILMIFIGFLGMFADMGTSAALIHLTKPSEKLLSSVFFFNIFVGAILCIALTLLSIPIAAFFEMPKIEELLPIISVNFIIISFGVVQQAQYEKNLKFKRVTLLESLSLLIGVTAGIIAAVNGLGVYSLIILTLTNSIFLVTLMWLNSTWRPQFYFSLQEIKNIWSYTANLLSFNVINYFARNADNFLIGKVLGSSALGAYSLAYKIMLYPLQNISHVLIRILFPAFSLIKDDAVKFKRAYLRVIFFIALVSFPLMAGLITTAEVLVDVVFGDKWQGLALLLMILAPIGMMQSIMTTVGSLYMAKGNTKTMFKIGSANSIAAVLSFFIGIPFGVEGVAIAYGLANVIMLYPTLSIAWRQIDLSVKEGLTAIVPVFVIALVMSLSVALFGNILKTLIDDQIAQLILMIMFGVIVYLGLIRWKYGNFRLLLSELKG